MYRTKLIYLLVVIVIYSYNGNYRSSSSKCELKRPRRNHPLALVLLPKNYSHFPWPFTVPALKLGLQKLKSMHNLNPIIKKLELMDPIDTVCVQSHHALFKTVISYVEEIPDVAFGPICDYVLAPIARLMSFWKVPVLTTGGTYYTFQKEKNSEYKTLSLVGNSHMNHGMARLLNSLFRKFKWNKAKVIYHRNSYKNRMPLYCHAASAFLLKSAGQLLKNWPLKSYTEIRDSNLKSDLEISNFLKENIGNTVNIIVFCGDPDIIRRIILVAAKLKFTNGEYLFINIDIFSSPEALQRPWYRPNEPIKNKIARKAYRYLMLLTLKEPDETKQREFSKKIDVLARRDHGYKGPKVERVNSLISSLYDAIILYAYALNKTLNEGGSLENGSLVVKNMRNISFPGVYEQVEMGPHGDRYTEMSLLDMNPETGIFEKVAFQREKDIEMNWITGKSIDWGTKNNKPPEDKVKCGYDNSMCPNNNTLVVGGIVTAIIITFVIISIIIGILVHRRTKFLAELEAMNWRIPWDSLEPMGRFYLGGGPNQMEGYEQQRRETLNENGTKKKLEENEQNEALLDELHSQENNYLMMDQMKPQKKSFQSQVSNKQRNRQSSTNIKTETESIHSLDSFIGLCDSRDNAIFANTARYKGAIVTLKRVSKKIEINKELLLEIKKIKDLTNDHICRFIGACTDQNKECWVYEYCPKGSLEDILTNQQIKLDWMFKYSLMQDICRGMIYLHNNYGVHGNLKSTNCLVDSRFVLKITDFGLKGYRSTKREFLKADSHEYYRSLLWTSPEILNELGNTKPAAEIGTVKGDVYSFAIICQEIVYRKGVFFLFVNEGHQPISSQEIITHVSHGYSPPFRPSLYEEEGCTKELCHLIQDAWHEDPFQRPEFNSIKNQMKKLNKSGDSVNILDNLLSRMEQYATNLEDLVESRTKDYLKQKQKAEDLLYSMLPKSIAHQLINNQTVIAVSYDMVTIFFSDIVGFTALSAESTPMEIIALLNCLYTTFDSIIENFDVYKVETIGDAYMVCSGLPQLNGNLHAREISRMAIAFLAAISKFVIPHRPDKQLLLRIGIHSGPVCSGVVGQKMPRYCLFGDTVNTSSRMESNGQPLKIHISSSTKEILDTFGTFIIRDRGYVSMKGKGSQLTYWLHGENNVIVDPLPEDEMTN